MKRTSPKPCTLWYHSWSNPRLGLPLVVLPCHSKQKACGTERKHPTIASAVSRIIDHNNGSPQLLLIRHEY
eukprot:scaffold7551_cov168-Amphora_coffeaeformis.AAC.4